MVEAHDTMIIHDAHCLKIHFVFKMKTKDKGSLFMVEAHGPGFSSLMIETFTEKQMMTRQTIQSILKLFK